MDFLHESHKDTYHRTLQRPIPRYKLELFCISSQRMMKRSVKELIGISIPQGRTLQAYQRGSGAHWDEPPWQKASSSGFRSRHRVHPFKASYDGRCYERGWFPTNPSKFFQAFFFFFFFENTDNHGDMIGGWSGHNMPIAEAREWGQITFWGPLKHPLALERNEENCADGIPNRSIWGKGIIP